MGSWEILKKWLKSDTALLVGLALIGLIVHLVFSRGYGYFRDEFYYLTAFGAGGRQPLDRKSGFQTQLSCYYGRQVSPSVGQPI